jgi:hypothetical protein
VNKLTDAFTDSSMEDLQSHSTCSPEHDHGLSCTTKPAFSENGGTSFLSEMSEELKMAVKRYREAMRNDSGTLSQVARSRFAFPPAKILQNQPTINGPTAMLKRTVSNLQSTQSEDSITTIVRSQDKTTIEIPPEKGPRSWRHCVGIL